MITQLRDYQAKAIHAAKVIYSKGRRRFVIYGPTGSGKTVLAESFIRGAVAKGSKVAFVANRIGLVAQASAHLTRAGIAHGIVQGANTEGTHHPVLAAITNCQPTAAPVRCGSVWSPGIYSSTSVRTSIASRHNRGMAEFLKGGLWEGPRSDHETP